MSDLIKYGIFAGVGYFLYTKFLAAPGAPAPGETATAPGTTPPPPPASTPPAPPPYQYTPPTTLQALKAAANPATTATADVWNFYYGHLTGKTALIDGFDAVFFPNGRPTNVVDTPKITAEQFLAGLATKGLSGGLQWLGGVRVPQRITLPAAAAVLRARARNYIPAGTPMFARGSR